MEHRVAVYKRTYKPFGGALTRESTRFLILARFSAAELKSSRPLMLFFVVSFLPVLGAATLIYLANNEAARVLLKVQNAGLLIDSFFFGRLFSIQATIAFLLTAWIGPGLISTDLNHDALQLFLSRPLTRFEYLLGKFSLLAFVLSAVTWVPGLFLFGMQANMAPNGWLLANLRIAAAIVIGAWVWIFILALLALALSAWVKWRIAATALMLAVFFVPAGFGEVVNEVLRTQWGKLLNLGYLMNVVWFNLFGVLRPIARRRGVADDIPVWSAWLMLLCVCVFCVWMLDKRLRAREVVSR
jgi:ABC-2 type transport system permease protein